MKATLSSQDGDEKVSLWHVLRQTQRKTGCTDKTLEQIKQSLVPLLKSSCHNSSSKKKSDVLLLHKANAVLLQLHGCVGCDHYVFLPSDARIRCPECGHPRFNAQRKPNEVTIIFGQSTKIIFVHHHFIFVYKYIIVCGLYLVCHCLRFSYINILLCTQVCWYFPLTNQIKRLLKSKMYVHHLKYEFRRRAQNGNYMADVYDSPRWAQVAGKMTSDRVTRIVMQLCVDAFPWSSRKNQVFFFYKLLNIPNIYFFSKLNGQHFQNLNS